MAMNAPPNALRSTTVTFGTVASANACTSLAPWRMTPMLSCLVPGMKPGVSTSTTSGRPKALQVRTKRAALAADSASSTPPRYFGWLAMTPTERPSRRGGPHRTVGAPVEPDEAAHDVARPALAVLEQAAAVDDPADHVAHVVDLALVIRDRVARVVADRVGRAPARRALGVGARQVVDQVPHEQRRVV